MSYTNETTYYGLPLPTGSDKSTFTDNNTAFQAVDAALHTAYEQSGAATEDIVAIKATVANLIQADINFQNDLDTEKGKIRNLQDKEVLQDTEIAAVKADAFDMITAYNEPTATSAHAYNVGDYFIYNDVLYKATESIAIGDTIVPDTNCETTNVTSELKAINAEIEALDTIIDYTALCSVTNATITQLRCTGFKNGNLVKVNANMVFTATDTACDITIPSGAVGGNGVFLPLISLGSANSIAVNVPAFNPDTTRKMVTIHRTGLTSGNIYILSSEYLHSANLD